MMTQSPPSPTLPKIPVEFIETANRLYTYLNSPEPSFGDKLLAIYGFTDAFEPYVATFAACSKGCSHCCKIDVQITALEAEMICVGTGIPHASGANLTRGHSSPCPFLSGDGSCGIYENRPLVCRVYHAVGDPENCRPGRMQHQYGAPPLYGNPIYQNLMNWVHGLAIHTGSPLRDIRDWFPHPRAKVQSHLSGLVKPAKPGPSESDHQ